MLPLLVILGLATAVTGNTVEYDYLGEGKCDGESWRAKNFYVSYLDTLDDCQAGCSEIAECYALRFQPRSSNSECVLYTEGGAPVDNPPDGFFFADNGNPSECSEFKAFPGYHLYRKRDTATDAAPAEEGAASAEEATGCQKRDFVNANSSPVVEDVAFTRNTDMSEADFASPGNLVFSIRFPSFATLDSIRFENDDEAGSLIANHDSVVGDVSTAALDADDNNCSSVFTSNEMAWMDFKDALTLKDAAFRDVDPPAYNSMHYRAEIVVQTTNKYDRETLSSDGVDALPEGTENESTRTVTSSFQLYFTLPQYVQAFTTITVASLPDAALEETIQMGDVSTLLNRNSLVYTSTFELKSKVNWPYRLTDATVTADEADANSAKIEETKTGATCTRTGVEDDEAVCEQEWLVTVTYSAGCEEELAGTIDLVYTYSNVLPGSTVDDGTTSYEIVVSSEAIQCDVNAGDLDMTASLTAEGTDFQIGGDATFTMEITNLQTPGVSVTSLTLNEVRTTQTGEMFKQHYINGGGMTGAAPVYSGDGGQPAVSNVQDGVTSTTFDLNLHQTLFNLEKFFDGSTQDLLVDAQAEIGYSKDGGRRRRLLNIASRAQKKGASATIKVKAACEVFAAKNNCKAAKALKCRWSKRQCRQAALSCNKLGPKQCKKSPKCQFKQKTKSCKSINAKKLKCADIANTKELCSSTPGCLALYAGDEFKSCRGVVRLG